MGDQSGIAVYAGKLFFLSFRSLLPNHSFFASLVGLRCCVSVTVPALCHCTAVAAMAPWLLVLHRSRSPCMPTTFKWHLGRCVTLLPGWWLLCL